MPETEIPPWSVEEFAALHDELQALADAEAFAMSKGRVKKSTWSVEEWARRKQRAATPPPTELDRKVLRFFQLATLQGPGGPFDHPSLPPETFSVASGDHAPSFGWYDTRDEALAAGPEEALQMDEQAEAFYLRRFVFDRGLLVGLGDWLIEHIFERLQELYEDDVTMPTAPQVLELDAAIACVLRDWLHKHGRLREFMALAGSDRIEIPEDVLAEARKDAES